MKTGELIRKYRKSKKITMKALGEEIGVSEQAISQYERGTRKPSLEILIKISDALNVSINDLSNKKELSPVQLLLKQEVLDKGMSFKDLSLQTGVSEEDINNIYNCTGLKSMEPFFDLFRYFGLEDDLILNTMVTHYKINSIYNNDGSDPDKKILRDMFLSAPLTQKESSLGIEKMDNSNFAEYISTLAESRSVINSKENIESKSLEKFKDKQDEINQLKPLLAYHGLNFSINKYNSIYVSIPKFDIYADVELDIFLDFINKVSWGIDREIDCLKRDFFDID